MAGWKPKVIFDIMSVAASALFIALMMRCTMDLAGGSSEIGNGIVFGRVVDEQGNPASRTIVRIMPSDYNPLKDGPLPDTCADTTDTDGRYRFVARHGQNLSIQGVHMALRTRVIVPVVALKNADLNMPQCTLKAPGAIKISLPDGIDPLYGYVNVPGSEIFAFLNNSAGSVTLDSVPAGVIPAVDYSSTANSFSTIIRYEVPVIPGETTAVWNPAWKYARRLVLNTTTTGANVAGTVTNFPVLVRLRAGNFDFNRAKADGGDVRFTKADGTPLPYEIERWDPIAGLAEVWVRVDTVYGNNSMQSITMYWGNPDASDGSTGAAVFDTAAGFAGVWHLAQAAGAIAPDATANNLVGTATATTTVTGAIGKAQEFNGISSFIRASGPAVDKLNYPENGSFSVSAWVRTNVLDSVFHGIVYKSNEQYGLQMRPYNEWEFYTYFDKSRWEMSRSPASDISWHALTGVRNGSKQYLYVDGRCLDSSIVTLSTYLVRVTDQPLEIGHCPDGGNDPDRYFNGSIDEVRISKVAYEADWIKLSYMNQKERDALVKW